MKTILFNTIDGHDVVAGFSTATIEPVETNKAVRAALVDTPEQKALDNKKSEFESAVADRASAFKARDNGKYRSAIDSIKTIQSGIIPLASDLSKKIIALRAEHAVYFEPRKGEVISNEQQIDTILKAVKDCPAGCCIDLDGKTVEDNRGRVYFRKASGKWGRTNIINLGDTIPSDAVLAEDVTDAQRDEIEADRVAGLPAAERRQEKDKAMGSALNSAADMKSRLEIQSDPDALTKSQDWYQAEVAIIEGLYG